MWGRDWCKGGLRRKEMMGDNKGGVESTWHMGGSPKVDGRRKEKKKVER